MKKSLSFAIFVTLLLNIYSVQAKDLKGSWSLGISGGLGINLSEGSYSDWFPRAYVLSGDLSYMIKENIGIVPVAYSYLNFTFDKVQYREEMSYILEFLSPWFAPKQIDTSVWALGFTPGVLFTSSGESKVRVFGQAGAGFYYFKWSLETDPQSEWLDEEKTEIDFGMLLGGGIEADIYEKATFVGKVRYHLIATEDEKTTLIDFMGGIKFYF